MNYHIIINAYMAADVDDDMDDAYMAVNMPESKMGQFWPNFSHFNSKFSSIFTSPFQHIAAQIRH
jgi:hypothetical protein